MVEVDVFWAYGLGAGFATAAAYQLQQRRAATEQEPKSPVSGDAGRGGLLANPYFAATVLFCAVIFAPSGAWLLWGFPDWETMQVAVDHSSLPAWLVAAFAATNVTQGVLGFCVAKWFIERGDSYAASLQFGAGYLGMFFILVHGWDGRGYQRFFSADRQVFAAWPAHPSLDEALTRVGDWVSSPVALTLYGMSVVLIPVMAALMLPWLREGQREAGVPVRGPITMIGGMLLAVFGVALGTAIGASVIIHLLGWWIGVPVAATLCWLVVLRRGTGLAYLVYRLMGLPEDASRPTGTPAPALSTAVDAGS